LVDVVRRLAFGRDRVPRCAQAETKTFGQELHLNLATGLGLQHPPQRQPCPGIGGDQMKRREVLQVGASALVLPFPAFGQTMDIDETRALAREAYIYAFPMVENYLSIYQFALDPGGSQWGHGRGDANLPA
jgi:hypothetical protein